MISKLSTLMLIAIFSVSGLIMTTSFADDIDFETSPPPQTDTTTDTQTDTQTTQTDQATSTIRTRQERQTATPLSINFHRASQLIGKEATSIALEDIGEVKDLIVDVDKGRIPFAIISVGGLGDLAESLFAVPFHAITLAPETDGMDVNELEIDDLAVRVSVDVNRLQEYPYLFRNEWPDFNDTNYTAGIFDYYGLDPYWDAATVAPVTQETATMQTSGFRKLSELMDADVQSPTDEDLGEVEDFLVDMTNGYISYAIMETEGALDLGLVGETQFAVPWRAFNITYEGGDMDEPEFTLDVTQDRLTGAPNFGAETEPDFDDLEWGRTVHTHYNVTPYWEEPGFRSFETELMD